MEWRDSIKNIGIGRISADLGLTHMAVWKWANRKAFPTKDKYKPIMAIAQRHLPTNEYHKFCASFTSDILGENI